MLCDFQMTLHDVVKDNAFSNTCIRNNTRLAICLRTYFHEVKFVYRYKEVVMKEVTINEALNMY